jgi:hypothetical protein
MHNEGLTVATDMAQNQVLRERRDLFCSFGIRGVAQCELH